MEEHGKFVLRRRRYVGELRVKIDHIPDEYVLYSRFDKNGFRVRETTQDVLAAKLFSRSEAERILDTPQGSRYMMVNLARHLIEEAMDS